MKNLKYVKLFDNFTTEESKNSVKFKITDKFKDSNNFSWTPLQPENDKSTFGDILNDGVWHLIGYSEANDMTSFYFAKFDKNKMQIDLESVKSEKVKERDENGNWTGKMVDGDGHYHLFKMIRGNENNRILRGDLKNFPNIYEDLELSITDFYPSKFESLEPGQVDDMDRFIVA